jgi:hypothetical protein
LDGAKVLSSSSGRRTASYAITEGVVFIYLDILIFTSSLDEHQHITQEVLDCMHKHKLYL